MQKTDEVIQVISQRIHNLEEEQRELVEFQQLERQRRCIEFELTDRDWRTAQERADATDIERRDVSARLNEAQRDATQLRAQLGSLDGDIQQEAGRKQRLVAEREEAERARGARGDELARAKLELEDERKRVGNSERTRAEAQVEMQQVKQEIRDAQAELQRAQPELAAELAKKSELTQQRQICETRRDQFLAKQGRKSQYSSVEQRNRALGEDITRRQGRREKCMKML